jgi:hypothetical protein
VWRERRNAGNLKERDHGRLQRAWEGSNTTTDLTEIG